MQQEGEGNEVVGLIVGGVVHLTSQTTLLCYNESLLTCMINIYFCLSNLEKKLLVMADAA